MDENKKYIGELEECNNENSALKINSGVHQPTTINPNFTKFKKTKLSTQEYVAGIKNGNINILSRAITLIESTLTEDNLQAQEIIEKCLPDSGKSIRIGITGVPGVGKSTFIESLGVQIVDEGKKLAVLAIDPSSEKNKGSILGDKTRMEKLAIHPRAYIRPSPSSGTLGGIARKTREIIILCETAGFDVIFIETVGVGQSETAVHSMVDFFLLLMLSGAGDELQGIKRGIIEMSDAIVITKSDDNETKSNIAKLQYQNALHLFPATESRWIPKVLTCSAIKNKGIKEIWELINKYKSLVIQNGFFEANRKRQAIFWLYETINTKIKEDFYNNQTIKNNINNIENQILEGKISSFQAAKILMDSKDK
ncbi:MAG: methylmalonyl Co-A mutase-associated GTPase MeaB [Bacteroidales bacterium]|jgi:LAO/AO transport system kinase|nr:methylmalonyl Co-A mutase-associated GTPase MeaB [Bacteroidales bacterium]